MLSLSCCCCKPNWTPARVTLSGGEPSEVVGQTAANKLDRPSGLHHALRASRASRVH